MQDEARSKQFEIIWFEMVEDFKYLVKKLQPINIIFTKKSGADWNQGMLATVCRRIFCLQDFYPNFEGMDIQNYNFAAVLYGCDIWSLTVVMLPG